MEAGDGRRGTVSFGRFELDYDEGLLRRAGHPVRLRGQPFKVLTALLDRPGDVVTREELRSLLWGDDTFVDFDQGLNYCIKEVRAALADQADSPAFVETLPRRGYRWIGPPPVARPAPPTAAVPVAAPAPPGPEAAPIRSRHWRGRIALGALALAAVAVLLLLATRDRPVPRWRRLTFRQGWVTAARFAPGGEVAFSAAWAGQPPQLFVVRPGLPDARVLGSEGGHLAALDGSTVDTLPARPAGRLEEVALAGGPARPLLEGVLAADRRGGERAVIVQVPRQGSWLEWPPGHRLRPSGASELRLAPDGRHLALLERPFEDARGTILVVDRGGEVRAASGEWGSAAGLAWQSADEVWFTAARAGGDRALRTLDLSGRSRTVLPPGGGFVLHDLSEGRALVERRLERAEMKLDAETGPGRDLAWFDGSVPAALSRDGRTLLFGEVGEAGGATGAAYLRGTDGSPPVRLADGLPTDLSPDGRTALIVAQPTGEKLLLVPVGPGVPRELRHSGIIRYRWAAFLPDGRGLLVTAQEAEHNLRVWVADLVGGRPRPITPDGLVLTRNTISPDGAWVAAPCPVRTSCLYPVAGGKPRPIPGLDDSLPIGWDRDGRLLVRERTWPPRVDRLDVERGTRSPWREVGTSDPVGRAGPYTVLVAPDTSAWITGCTRVLSELFVVDGLR